ncbi:MAG: pyruvate, phosphate dikinase [Proteobacteria bacterium]|nr:pyruvate, phosphate dikinase [Pseudomonadota bacterium]
MAKHVYSFGDGRAEGSASERDLLGGKGANLAEMCNLGLPVPPGFTITAEVCRAYYANAKSYPEGLKVEATDALRRLEAQVGASFGDAGRPLLVSVRSGARASMPGMMETVLNLGLNDETVEGLARQSKDARFAFDSYRRFIQMYGDVVLGVEHHEFEEALARYKETRGLRWDTELTEDDWREIVSLYRDLVEERLGRPFPQDVDEQLWGAIGAVFDSWMNRRAITYRQLHGMPDSSGTAVSVQAMVFGNMGDGCATGVAFTRNPSTGEKLPFGEYLLNAQGEDVVAGIRTPHPLTRHETAQGSELVSFEEAMPEIYGELVKVFELLESHYRDMQDIEFTVQCGKLWMLQTRVGKRTVQAALKIAVAMVAEGVIGREEAVRRIDPDRLEQLLHPGLDPSAPREVIARGLPASPGAATGAVVFSSDDARERAARGDAVILVRTETSPEDIHGMHAARGILTSRGGMTSHAAVVARGMGRACVSGASAVRIDHEARLFTAGNDQVLEGEVITIDGSTGEVMRGEVPMVVPELSGDFRVLMGWADSFRTLIVRANAETPPDAETALSFGAEGIGLCRTEHMFFEENRIVAIREMILAEDEPGRCRALDKLLPMQRADFVELFRIMAGHPVTIRLLDPPLHEFLPKLDDEIADFASDTGIDPRRLRLRIAQLQEVNPMLGHRGCRLGISYPEIYEMQVRAVFEAAIDVGAELDQTVVPEIMIPLVASRNEFDLMKALVERVADRVAQDNSAELHYLVGTMIELPRAALCAHSIAEAAEFFSFGTNDLTQTTFGISRDDATSFLDTYTRRRIFEADPFVSLDQEGVGRLMRLAVEEGRAARPDLHLGICGEHGGDPASIRFCQGLKLDYVSCSPYRVPIARLAAAQAALEEAE